MDIWFHINFRLVYKDVQVNDYVHSLTVIRRNTFINLFAIRRHNDGVKKDDGLEDVRHVNYWHCNVLDCTIIGRPSSIKNFKEMDVIRTFHSFVITYYFDDDIYTFHISRITYFHYVHS